MPQNLKEQMKLVNGISFLGVPICLTFILLFGFTGYWYLMLTFSVGIFIFILPWFFNKWIGVKTASIFVCLAAPILFGSASVISGKDTGFFLGFLVISVPPIIVFPKIKTAAVFILYAIMCLALSIMGNMFIQPIETVTYAMGVFLFNLFTVLISTLGIVLLFKIELNESLEKLFEKNREITDSINYAKKIQYTLLAHDAFLIENMPQHFVYFQPKDIVSGDFYWATSRDNKFYLAVCDSTGHGVPGAFMSLLNIGFLSEAINEKQIYKPNEVFDFVRERLTTSISKDGQKDGFDGILICIDKTTNTITYSAANNKPVLINTNVLTEAACDKMPVGVGEKKEDFKLHTLTAKKGNMLYLYTDGYADQFGGPKGKKFKYKQLNEQLLASSNLPMHEQKQQLETIFENWRGDIEQTDDVCVIGIRI